jgi:hypothetical protein
MADEGQRVVVTDVEMPFGSMVIFMVKWALAAIPALVILTLIGVSISLALTVVVGPLNQLSLRPATRQASQQPYDAQRNMRKCMSHCTTSECREFCRDLHRP